MNMNYAAPSTTFFSNFRSLFQFPPPPPQPTFTPAMPTRVYITQDTTTHIDPPPGLYPLPINNAKSTRHSTAFPVCEEKRQHDYFVYPATPRAPSPRRTTFFLSLPLSTRPQYPDDDPCSDDSDRISLGVPSGHTIVCHPTAPGVYTLAEPRTLARALFFLGFFLPPFWIVGIAIMMMPLRPTPDWEAGKTSIEIEWACKVIRQTELRWARLCLIALLSEMTLIITIILVVKFGILQPDTHTYI